MKNNEKSKKNIGESIKTFSAGVALVVTVGGVVSAGLNAFTAYKLAPLTKDLEIVKKAQADNETLDKEQHPTFATHDELDKKLNSMIGEQKEIKDMVKYLYQKDLN